MVWPCKQNVSETASQVNFTCYSEWEEASWTTTRWLDYIEDLGRNRLGLRPCKIQPVFVDQGWRLNTELLPKQPSRKSDKKRRPNETDSMKNEVKTIPDLHNTALQIKTIEKRHIVVRSWFKDQKTIT